MIAVVLFGQAIEQLPSWAQLAGGIVSWGFAVWYAWYTTTKTIPEMNTKHNEIVERLTAMNSATAEKLVSEFRDEAREARANDIRRAQVSQELAVSGHKALSEVKEAVNGLKAAVESMK